MIPAYSELERVNDDSKTAVSFILKVWKESTSSADAEI